MARSPQRQSARNIPPQSIDWKGVVGDLATQPFWRLMVAILVAGLLILLLAFWFSKTSLLAELPVTMHSSLKADYSADPNQLAMGPVQMGLIQDVLIDQAKGGGEPVVQLQTMVSNLKTPVPTVTLLYTPIFKGTPIPTKAAFTATAVKPQSTNTLPATLTPTPQATVTYSAPATATKPPAAVATATPRPAEKQPTDVPPPTSEPKQPTEPPPPPPPTAVPPTEPPPPPPPTEPPPPPPPDPYPGNPTYP